MTEKHIFITGGASGIGLAIAERFLLDGYKIAICDADAAAVAAFQSTHPESIACVADVTDEKAMTAMFNRLESEWKHIDVVCANAGTGGETGAIETLDFAEWQRCIATNLDGAFLTCRWAARMMKPKRAGLIMLTASTAGIMGYPLRAPYAAAKWGMIGLGKTLAMELGPFGIRVNVICPGSVEGPRMQHVIAKEAAARGMTEDEVRACYVKGVSMKTWIKPQDIADTIHFLASSAGGKISGQVLSVDGHTETLGV